MPFCTRVAWEKAGIYNFKACTFYSPDLKGFLYPRHVKSDASYLCDPSMACFILQPWIFKALLGICKMFQNTFSEGDYVVLLQKLFCPQT